MSTGFSLSAVNHVLILVPAVAARRLYVVADTRPAAFDRGLEYSAHRFSQASAFRPRQLGRGPQRANAGKKQRFVRVDVAHPGEHGLIEKQGFDGGASLARCVPEVIVAHA